MADAGAAVMIADHELTSARLAHEVATLLADPSRLDAMAGRASARAARRRPQPWPASCCRGRRRVSAAERPWRRRRLHFVGVGGAGMSGYARAAHALGARVTGSDRRASPSLERLRSDGVLDAVVGHAAENLPAGDDVELIYSSAVAPDNPERAAARSRGVPERPRADLLAELTALRRTIAVAGTHGKTTTASMLVHALLDAGLEPGWLVGSTVGGGRSNAQWGRGEWLVVEADESDRSMLSLNVEIGVLTNVELDHHATFGSLHDLREAFRAFLARATQAVIWDRPELLALRAGPAVAYDAPAPVLTAGGSRFEWRGHQVQLSVPGAHNAVNAAGALEAARLAGADAQRRRARAGRVSRIRAALSGARAVARGRAAGRRLRASPHGGRGHPACRPHARARSAGGGVPAAPVLAHRRCSPASSASRWRWPTWSWSSTSIPRASAPRTTRA